MNILERYESATHNYLRTSPIIFDKARGAELFDERGNRYINFHTGGGSLCYAHDETSVRRALIDYLSGDRIIQTADRASVAKRRFVETFVSAILEPRNLNYRILFTDPASGSAAETALRIARRRKNRSNIIAFTNASHGLTEGSLSVTSRNPSRYESVGLRANSVFMPYCDYLRDGADTIAYLRRYLEDATSGLDSPAAVIVETVQVHGGVQIASPRWLKALEELCREFDILLIVDESETGCGRTGPYFSFERAGIVPDIVLVSNAIAGGLPMSMLLLRPELDRWRPGEQSGVFQGNALAFVAAAEILTQWAHASSRSSVHAEALSGAMASLAACFPNGHVYARGLGMTWGLDFGRPGSAAVISSWALERGLVIEPARIREDVLLVLPPLTIEEGVLREGLQRLKEAVSMFLGHKR